MSDISREDLKKEIQDILKDADLDNTSAKKVRLQLQEKLDCDLTERKKEVDALVMEVIDEQTQDEEGEEEEEESEEEEEEEKPTKKAAARKRADSGSDSDEDEEPSDGGGSDYEPDEPVKIKGSSKKAAAKRKNKFGSDVESSGEEWGGGASAKKKKKTQRKKKADSDDDDDEKPKKKRKAGAKNGYIKPVKLSADLADIVGGEEMPRHEVVKRMWQYIKDNNLQDPKNRQMIKCDDKLSKVIPTKKFRGFGMAKFLKDHMNVE